jgi:hypothetical protein
MRQNNVAEQQLRRDTQLSVPAEILVNSSASPSAPAVSQQALPKKRGRPRKALCLGLDVEEKDPLPRTSFAAHYHMSELIAHYIDILKWINENRNDPALKASILPCLIDNY